MKMIFKYLVIVLMLYPIAGAYSQQNQLSLQLGASHLDRQDQIFTPFVQTGNSIQHLGVSWERSQRWEQFLNVGYTGFTATRFDAFDYTKKPDPDTKTTLPHGFTFVDIDYGLGKKWQARAYTFSAGGALQNSVQALNYQYGDASFFGYFATFSIHTWLRISRAVGQKGALHAGLSIPFMAWVARSPYLIDDDEFIENASSHDNLKTFAHFISDGKLQFPNHLQKLNTSLGYDHQFGQRLNAGVCYNFQFIRYTNPLTLLSYQHDLSVKIGWKF